MAGHAGRSRGAGGSESFPDVSLEAGADPAGRPAIRIRCAMPDSADVAHHPFQAEIDELVECVLAGRETSISVFDAQKTMEICLAADRSAEHPRPPGRAAADWQIEGSDERTSTRDRKVAP